MIKYIIKRLIYGILVLLGVVTIIFLLFNVLPADPARMILGQRADISSVEAINKDLGLDKPLITQYVNYLNDLSPLSIHNVIDSANYWYFDKNKYSSGKVLFKITKSYSLFIKKPYLRRSYQSKRLVTDIINEALPATTILAIASIIFALILGVLLGIVSALKKDTFIDKIITVVSVLGMSLPSFFAAIIISWLFAYVLHNYTGLNMVGSLYTIDDLGRGEYINLKNLILPAFTLGIRPLAVISELTRSSMLDVLSQDYIRTAKAKGLSYLKIIFKHALRNSLNPVVTAASGWFASLMAGAVFVEYVFDWKGLGVVIVDALDKYDFPVLMGTVLVISIILVFINIFVDIIYGYLDPRIRLK
ncbi:MAG TPA: ABC transporter permease [Bacteroidales bacterium]|nr:ABC transporter permease [Bacteroidales bacterium]